MSDDKTIVKPGEPRRGTFSCGGKGKLGETVINRVHWRKLGVQTLLTSPWLRGDSLSVAALLLGKEKSFCWGTRVENTSLLEIKAYLFQSGTTNDE